MTIEFQYDVLLTHNAADKPRVRRLAERLRAARTLACPAEACRRRRKRSTVGRGNSPFRHPVNAGCRFIPLLLGDYTGLVRATSVNCGLAKRRGVVLSLHHESA